MHAALEAGQPVRLDQVGLFADGVAVRQVGEEPLRLAREYVDEVILVTTDETCAAIRDIYQNTRTIAEPAGALGVAGVKRYVEREGIAGALLVAIDSGANVNFDRLRHIAERAEVGEQREMLLAVTIPERAGSLLEFCRCIGERSVTEFNYRHAGGEDAQIFLGLELRDGADDRAAMIGRIADLGYPSSTSATTRWRRCTFVTWWGGGRPQPTSACSVSSSPSARAPCSVSSPISGGAGTSVSSTTGTTGPRTEGC